MTTSTRRRLGAQTRKWAPPSGFSSAPTGRRRCQAGLPTVRARPTGTAGRDGALMVMVAACRLSTIVGDLGEGSRIREASRIGAREIDEMEADAQRFPANVADPLAARDLIVPGRRARVDGAEQAVHRMHGHPRADAVHLSLVTLEGHAIGRLVHRKDFYRSLQLLVLTGHRHRRSLSSGMGRAVDRALDRCSREMRTIV